MNQRPSHARVAGILVLVFLVVSAGCLSGGEPAPERLDATGGAGSDGGAGPGDGERMERAGNGTNEGGNGTGSSPDDGDDADSGNESGDPSRQNASSENTDEGVQRGRLQPRLDPTEVVVATFDTGTNPFHPCFRRPGAHVTRAGIPGFPANRTALNLHFLDTYDASLEASRDELDRIEPGRLYHVPGTRLLYQGFPGDFIDSTPHGSQASSQIGCESYGMAPNAWLLVTRSLTGGSDRARNMAWVAAQDWIDVVHLNIAEGAPLLVSDRGASAVDRLVTSGKFVIVAAGNGVGNVGGSYPSELSTWSGPPGILVAGANDNGGYTYFSNLDPHVVMDGSRTRAAEPYGYGETSFGGTSSSSPRVTGYVSHLLREAREAYGDHLVVRDSGPRNHLIELEEGAPLPGQGPLKDGVLTVAELHEVVRKTADPNPHESQYDGDRGVPPIPQPADLPASFYPKMGYGEISEHTLMHALRVLLGVDPMPERPYADAFFEHSEQLRRTWWEDASGA